MGVPLDGPANVMADNMSVVKNTSIPESVLRKKSNSIAYHYVRERAASGSILVRHERTDSNIADILTKIQPHSVRERLLRLLCTNTDRHIPLLGYSMERSWVSLL